MSIDIIEVVGGASGAPPTIAEAVAAWRDARNEAPDDSLDTLDAMHAASCGLQVLAALLRTRNELGRTARGRAVAEEWITPLIHVAVGEATERLQVVAGEDSIRCPAGVGADPGRVLERERQRVTVEEAAAMCEEWETRRGHSAPAIRSACASGALPAELRGKVWYIEVAALREWASE
jgi:hypothetical protein